MLFGLAADGFPLVRIALLILRYFVGVRELEKSIELKGRLVINIKDSSHLKLGRVFGIL